MSCPAKVLDIDPKTGDLKAVRPQDCVFCEECCRKVEKGALNVG